MAHLGGSSGQLGTAQGNAEGSIGKTRRNGGRPLPLNLT